MSAQTSYLAGIAAEGSVERLYEQAGNDIVANRWRGRGGEIDIIARNKDQIIFIEVKKSRTFDQAALHLSPAQCRRIYATGSEYLANEPLGQDTPVRFDVALVDAMGQISVIENAISF